MKRLAELSFWSALTFLVLLTLLHFIEPEFDPSWHFISDYQSGNFGWMMSLAFFSLALSCISLSLVLWTQLNIGGRIGLFLLIVSAAGMIIAAIFITDPINTEKELWSYHGKLHQLGATLDLLPFAAALISFNLIRKNELWTHAKKVLLWSTVVVWIGLIVFIVFMVILFPPDGKFGPNVLLGWPNRLMIVVQCLWLITMSYQAIKLYKYHKPAMPGLN